MFHGSLCCQWQLSKGEQKTNCVVLLRITGVFLVEWRKHIPPTIPFLDLAKTEQTCYFPTHFLCYRAYISLASHSFIAYTDVLPKRHTTDASALMTPFFVQSIQLTLDADFSKRGDSRRMEWYSTKSFQSPFSFSLPVIIQPLLRSSSDQVREGFQQIINYRTIGV
jgi:hypothetical protein